MPLASFPNIAAMLSAISPTVQQKSMYPTAARVEGGVPIYDVGPEGLQGVPDAWKSITPDPTLTQAAVTNIPETSVPGGWPGGPSFIQGGGGAPLSNLAWGPAPAQRPGAMQTLFGLQPGAGLAQNLLNFQASPFREWLGRAARSQIVPAGQWGEGRQQAYESMQRMMAEQESSLQRQMLLEQYKELLGQPWLAEKVRANKELEASRQTAETGRMERARMYDETRRVTSTAIRGYTIQQVDAKIIQVTNALKSAHVQMQQAGVNPEEYSPELVVQIARLEEELAELQGRREQLQSGTAPQTRTTPAGTAKDPLGIR